MAVDRAQHIMYRKEFADLYDAEYAEFKGDISFWKKVITSKKILEIGIGTGRIAVPLAKAGYQIVGIERSPDMLKILQRKIAGRKIETIRAVQGDMRDYELREKFDFGFIPFHLFHEVLTRRDQERTLLCARKHLKKNGKLGVDLFHFHQDQLENPDLLRWDKMFSDPSTGELWYRFVSIRVDFERQMIHHLLRYEYTGSPLKVLYCEVTFHYYTPFEILHLFEKCGFSILDLYGDYRGRAFDAESRKMIVLAQRM